MSKRLRAAAMGLVATVLAPVLLFGVVACSDGDPAAPLDGPGGELPGGDDPGSDPDPTPTPADLSIILAQPDAAILAAIAADYGLEVVEVYGGNRMALLDGEFDPVALRADERILAFQQDRETEFSTPVELTMSFFEGDFDDELSGQDAFENWNLDEVHALGRGAGVKVAVLDTGVDPDHPWLAGRVSVIEEGEWGLGSLEIPLDVDTDGDGIVDAAYGHGTHVAGTIATVAPDAEILVIRVLDSDGVGTAFDLARGLYRAVEWGADIINLSLVLSGEAEVIDQIIDDIEDDYGHVVGAAGNRPGEAMYPASEDDVHSVAALDAALLLGDFSASGDVDFGAPGISVLSSFPSGEWASATGTSMAAASASGALAVVGSILGDPDDADDFLENTVRILTPLDGGAIDLLAAAQLAVLSLD